MRDLRSATSLAFPWGPLKSWTSLLLPDLRHARAPLQPGPLREALERAAPNVPQRERPSKFQTQMRPTGPVQILETVG